MSSSLSKVERQIEDQNKIIMSSYIERNRIISESNIGVDLMVPGYKLNSNGKFLSVNIKFAQMLGYSSEQELMDAINEGKYVVLRSDLTSMFAKTDCVIDKPLYLRTRTGAFVSLLESILKCTEDGNVRYYALVRFKEPSVRAKQEDAIAWSLISQLLGELKTGVVICDQNRMIVYENPMMRQIMGFGTQDDLPYDSLDNYFTEESLPKCKSSLEVIFSTNQKNPVITYSLVKNGGEIINVSVYSYVFTFGEQKFCVSLVSPHTDSKHDNNTSGAGSYLTYRDTFDIMSELYILISENGDICDLNAAAAKMWGWDYKLYLTKSIFDLGDFGSTGIKRNLALLYDSQTPTERKFMAKNTIWGDLEMTCRLLPVGKMGQRYIAVVMENRRELQQVKDNLTAQYTYNLAMFDSSICGLILVKGNKIERVNAKAYSLLKIKYDIRGESLSEVLTENKRKSRRVEVTASNRKEEVFVYEIPSEGKPTQLEVHLYYINNENTLCYFIDRSLRKKGPSKSLNAASRYKLIVEQSPCGVLIGDTHGDIIDVSDHFCEMIKMSPSDILGKNISDLFTPSSVSSKPLDYTRVDAGEVISAERELKCGDGTVKVVEMYSGAISTDMYQAVVLDITDRKIYENKLISFRSLVQKMEVQKQHFLKTSKDVSVIFSDNAEIRDVFVGENSPFYTYYKNDEGFVAYFMKYISRKENDMIIKQGIARALSENASYVVRKDVVVGGINYIIEARFLPMESEVVMVVSDVTERERVIEQLNIVKKQSEENEKLQTAFLGNLSHELRTPMNAIIGFADLLLEDESNPEKQDYLRTILDSSYQLLNVLSDLIEVSKLEAGVMKVKSEIVSVKKVICDICASIRGERIIEENNVKLVNIAQEEDDVLIVSDNVKLRQIITNLISNALKFSKNGKVEVGYDIHDGSVCIYVRDNGIGISKEDLPKIFDRFFQVKGVELATKGTGLGLSIVKSYVDMLRGTIKVESELGKGTCFYVELQSRY